MGPLQDLFAAHAVSLGAIVVTNNIKDFAKYPGLLLENWLVLKINIDHIEYVELPMMKTPILGRLEPQ